MKKDEKKPQIEEAKSLSIIESETPQDIVMFDPAQDTEKGKIAADQLLNIIQHSDKGKYIVKINNQSEHARFEAWQTVGKYFHLSAKTEWTKYVEYGSVKGFEARAVVINNDTGMIVGAAESLCMNDEANWKAKPLFQLKSQAQTRACSKAFRQVLSWVIVLAGFNPTPAEEMEGVYQTRTTPPVVHSETNVSDSTTLSQSEGSNTNGTNDHPISEKQIWLIRKLLDEKGYLERELCLKYDVANITDLTIDQASTIIGNLMKLTTRVKKKTYELNPADELENVTDKDLDDIDKAIDPQGVYNAK